MTLELNTKLKYNLVIWYHYDKDNWTITGYKQLYTIKTIQEFWQIYNNWTKVGGITNKHYFIMKEGVSPIWEDELNKNGGSWSYKIQEDFVEELWEDLSIYFVCEQLCPTIPNEIMGLSIRLRKNNEVVIKIWNNDSKHNSLKLINEKLLKKWGTDIIYISH